MTDEAKWLAVDMRILANSFGDDEKRRYSQDMLRSGADLIETQAREIERLREALDNIANESSDIWAREKARAALAGDSHDQ